MDDHCVFIHPSFHDHLGSSGAILKSALIILAAAAAAKSLQSCPTLWDPIDGSPPGSPVPGILQARTLEWVAISFSNAGKWKVKVKSLSRVRLFETPWTAAYQAPPPIGFSARVLEWGAIAFSNRCEGWTIKKAECWRIDAFKLWCWMKLLRVLGQQGDQTSQS